MKKTNKTIIYAILLVVLMQSVLAIGVSPASIKLPFEPNLNQNVTIRILNDQHKDFIAKISVEGDLKDYIKINQAEIPVNSFEDSKSFTVEISLPQSFEKPGQHKTDIIIAESAAGENKGKISALLAVASQIIVEVPYPGVYAEAQMRISKAKVKEPVEFAIAFFNLGKEDLIDVWANIEIYDGGKKVKDIETDKITVLSKGKSKLSGYWISEKSGEYTAKAVVYYSNKKINLEQNFEVGGLELSIDGLNIHDFKLGEIVRLYTIVTNNLNKKINGAYGDVLIRDEKGNVVSQMKSATFDIEPFSTSSAVVYWDTKNTRIGAYTIDVTINHNNKKTGKTFNAYVYSDEVVIDGLITGRAITQNSDEKVNLISLLIIILINLVIINILLFLFIKKRPPKIENFNQNSLNQNIKI